MGTINFDIIYLYNPMATWPSLMDLYGRECSK